MSISFPSNPTFSSVLLGKNQRCSPKFIYENANHITYRKINRKIIQLNRNRKKKTKQLNIQQ